MNASRADLDSLQSKLKAAILNHAVLVRKIQGDPQNMHAQKELRDIQQEITLLSDKQRILVQDLKKEVEIKRMAGMTPPPAHTGSVIQKPPLFDRSLEINNHHQPSSSMHGMGNEMQPTNLSMRTQQPTVAPSTGKKFTPISPRPSAAVLVPLNFSSQQRADAGVPAKSAAHSTGQSANAIKVKGGVFNPPVSVGLSGGEPVTAIAGVLAVGNNSLQQKLIAATIPTAAQMQAIRVPSYTQHQKTLTPQTTSTGLRALLPKSSVKKAAEPSDHAVTTVATGGGSKRVATEKKEVESEEKQKLNFLGYLGLVSQDTIKDLLGRRSERKKRSTASSQFYYGHFDIDRRRLPPNGVYDGEVHKKKARVSSRPASPDSSVSSASPRAKSPESDKPDYHDDLCATCRRPGELLMCDTCVLVYHLRCLTPPLTAIPLGHWSCSRCLAKDKDAALPSVGAETQLINEQNGAADGAACTATADEPKQADVAVAMSQTDELAGEKIAAIEKQSDDLSSAIADRKARTAALMQSNTSISQCLHKIKGLVEAYPTTSA